MSAPPFELLTLDRDVKRAAARIDELRAQLRSGTPDALAFARARDPFGELRHTAGQSTYRALAESTPAAHEAPLRDALLRWIHELLQVRVGFDLEVDDVEALHAPDPRLPTRAVVATPSGDSDTRDPDAPLRTYAEALRAVLAAADAGRARPALDRAGELALPVAAARKERRARRIEVARRLGLAQPWSLATAADPRTLARALFDATEPLAVELFKDPKKRHEGPWRASSAIQLALAREAHDGWPARPAARWLDDAFHALAPRGVPIASPAVTLGASTFLRAAAAWGTTWKNLGAPRSMPFVLARDPYPIVAHRFGFALASVVAEPMFQRRALDLPARVAAAQARVLARTLFLAVRTLAARVILGTTEHVDAGAFEEVTMRAFGAPLPAAMRDAWPDPRIDDVAKLVALLGTPAFVASLVERFDEDWFRNPKTGTHLTSLACGPAHDADAPPEGAAERIGRRFEEALG